MITQSDDVLPSPVPFAVSLLLTDTIWQVAVVPHAGAVSAAIVTSAMRWSGGVNVDGVAVS